ncbi:MAG: hypothetical protein IJW38_04225 [Clostridia bacterium]|nr:hypothetical protein [Clostridia bacterium]
MKINLPTASSENEEFNLRFNAFYDAIFDAYIKEGEAYSKQCENNTRPATFTVECVEKTSPVGTVSLIRSFKLRLSTGEIKRGESLDIFDSATGLLVKEKRKLKFANKKKKS